MASFLLVLYLCPIYAYSAPPDFDSKNIMSPAAAPTYNFQRLRSALPSSLKDMLCRARELGSSETGSQNADLPTTLGGIDDLLSGGLVRGRLIELVGRRSSGRFSAVLSTLASLTARGENAVLVDLGDGLDPRAAETAGAVLPRILWLRPLHLKTALIGAEVALQCGFPLVALELGLPPVSGGRGCETSWLRLARAALTQRSIALISSPYRVSGTAASEVLEFSTARPLWRGDECATRLLSGFTGRSTLKKTRHQTLIEKSGSFRLLTTETLENRPRSLPNTPGM